MESEILCRCGKRSIEFVSFTEKNPGRRFVKCSSRYRSCGFWEWVEEPISPLVRSVMEVKAKKATEKKVKCLAIVIFSAVL